MYNFLTLEPFHRKDKLFPSSGGNDGLKKSTAMPVRIRTAGDNCAGNSLRGHAARREAWRTGRAGRVGVPFTLGHLGNPPASTGKGRAHGKRACPAPGRSRLHAADEQTEPAPAMSFAERPKRGTRGRDAWEGSLAGPQAGGPAMYILVIARGHEMPLFRKVVRKSLRGHVFFIYFCGTSGA